MLRLQEGLKKEFLLIEKEQQEKAKLKNEIQEHLNIYYQTLIETLHPANILVKDDGFDNCYNFVKDVLIGLSQNVEVGHCLLKLIDQQDSHLINFFVNVVYESLQSTDFFEKDITRLMHLLICDLFDDNLEEVKKERVLYVFQQYMKKEQIVMYFEMLASTAIRQIIQLGQELLTTEANFNEPKLELDSLNNKSEFLETENQSNRYSQSSDTSSILSSSKKIIIIKDKGKHFKEYHVEKNSIIKHYLQKVFANSELCPIAIKIQLKSCYENAKKKYKKQQGLKTVWKLVSPFLIKPFFDFLESDYISQEAKKICLELINYLIHEYHMVERLLYENLIPQPSQIENSPTSKKQKTDLIYGKMVEKLIEVNRERYQHQIVQPNKSQESKANENKIQIKIYGGCISFSELAQLIKLVVKHKDELMKSSLKVVNRATKIMEMSPKLSIFQPSKKHNQNHPNITAHHIFTSIVELQYSKVIEYDFHKEYTLVYKTDNLKNILRQVLIDVEIDQHPRKGYENGKGSTERSMFSVFISIQNETEKPGNKSTISAPLLMKIKYLIWLLNQQSLGGNYKLLEALEQKLFSSMTEQLEARSENNIKLYEDTKFSLLKVYSNLKHYKNQLKEKKEADRKTKQKLELMGWLDNLKFAVCLTSPSTRNCIPSQSNDTLEEVDSNKYKYRISSSEGIIMCDTKDCIHKENIFTGKKSHANCIIQFIQIFCSLKEVRHVITHPDFMSAIRDKQTVEASSHRQSKEQVRHVFYSFIHFVVHAIKKEQLLVSQESYYKNLIQEILFRSISEELVCSSQALPEKFSGEDDKSLGTSLYDIRLEQKMQEIAHILGSMAKLTDFKHSEITVENLHTNICSQNVTGINIEQLVEIGCRYLKTLNHIKTPMEKVKKLKEVFDVYKTLHKKYQHELQSYPLDYLLFKILVINKPKNFISNLSFIETFLNEEKLLSIEGKTLEYYKDIVKRIYTLDIHSFLELEINLILKQKGISFQEKHKEWIGNLMAEGKMERELRKHKIQSINLQ